MHDAALDSTAADPAPPTGISYVGLVLLMGALSGLGPLAIDMYLPSFPAIARDFGCSVAAVERTVAAYFVGLALGQLFYGPASDRFGRKRPLYVGLGLFILASVGCAAARGVHALVALRFLQALGGCAEMVIARAVVRDRFGARDAARVFSSLMLVMGLAPILAPLIGGWIVVHLGWRAIFGGLGGFAALCLVAVATLLPESHPPARRHRHGAGEIFRTYAGLLRHRVLMVNTMAGALVSAGMFAYIAGSPFVLMNLFGVRAERFGLFFGTNAAGLILCSQVNGYLARRADPRRVLRGALCVTATAGAALLVAAETGWGGFPGILVPLFAFVATGGFVYPTSTALAMAPHGRAAGNASAVIGCVTFLVSGLGSYLVGALHTGTAVPMAGVMAACGISALGLNLAFGRGHVAGVRGA